METEETSEEMIERLAIEMGIKKNNKGAFDFDSMICESCS